MDAKDYLKSKKIWIGTRVADMSAPENYVELEHLLEGYYQAKMSEILESQTLDKANLNTTPEIKIIDTLKDPII